VVLAILLEDIDVLCKAARFSSHPAFSSAPVPVRSGAKVDLFHPHPAQSWSIQSDVAHRLVITFGLTVTNVRADARDVATWHGPSDDELLTSIGARRGLGVLDAATYLRNLRTALGRAR
jgi:hypothetical protein